MARGLALAAAIVVSLLAVSGSGGAGAQTPKSGGVVVFGPVPEPNCLNPLTCANDNDFIVKAVLPAALAVAPDSTWKPRLVSSVTFTKKPPFTLTYRIRPEARWSDGIPVTSQDFVFTHNAIRSAQITDVHGAVRSIRALDAKTVRVVLGARDAGWRSLFPFVLPRHALAGEDLARVWSDRIDYPKTGSPIGSGPFLVGSWERGKQLTLVRNRRYWGPHTSYLDRIVVRFRRTTRGTAPPAEVLEAVRQGGIDFVFSRDTSVVPELRRLPGFRVFPAAAGGREYLQIRIGPGGHPALRDKRVRRALAYGIDRADIVRRLFGELDPRYPPSDSAIFQPSHQSYRPNWDAYRYRPAESRRLLAQAGCHLGTDDIYVCGGKKLELRLVTTAGALLRERHVRLIQAQLRQVGIQVVLSFAVGPALFGQLLPSGDFDLASFTGFYSPDATRLKDIYGCGGSLNVTGYCQRLLTRELDQADRILDTAARGRVLNRADQQLAQDVPVIPLYEVPFVLALRQTVRNVVVSPENLFWNAENWWLAP